MSLAGPHGCGMPAPALGRWGWASARDSWGLVALGGDTHRTDPDGFGAQSVPGRADGSTLLGFDPTAKPGPLRSVELPWNTETAIKLLTEHRYR